MVFYAYYFVSLLYVPFVLFHIIYKGTSCKSEWAYPVCTYYSISKIIDSIVVSTGLFNVKFCVSCAFLDDLCCCKKEQTCAVNNVDYVLKL